MADATAGPSAFARPRQLDVHWEVTRTANPQVEGAIDYRIRLWRPNGEPLGDADVWLRGTMADGRLVEARLDRVTPAGTYHGLIMLSPRGPRNLSIRVARGDGIAEIPVAELPRPSPAAR